MSIQYIMSIFVWIYCVWMGLSSYLIFMYITILLHYYIIRTRWSPKAGGREGELSYLAATTVGLAQEFERWLQLGLEWQRLGLVDTLLLHRPPGLVLRPPALTAPGVHQLRVAPTGLRWLLALAVWLRPSGLILLLDPHGHNHLRVTARALVARIRGLNPEMICRIFITLLMWSTQKLRSVYFSIKYPALCSKFNNIYKSVTFTVVQLKDIPFLSKSPSYYNSQGKTEPELEISVDICQINDELKPPARCHFQYRTNLCQFHSIKHFNTENISPN